MKSMKILLVPVVAFICLVLAIQPATAALTKIADNVYAYVDEKNPTPQTAFGANAGIIVGEDCVVVVDTLVSAKTAEVFLSDIRAVTDKPIRFVVDTHSHFDHVMGNCVFSREGALIVAQENCRNIVQKQAATAMDNIAQWGLTPEDMAGTKVVVPSISFQKEMKIDVGGDTVELMFNGPSHSPGNILVYVHKSKVLFTGDALFTDYHPFLGTGDIPQWLNVLDSILDMDVTKIIPGHGPISSKQDVKEMKEYITLFDELATKLSKEKDSVEDIVAALLEKLPQRSRSRFLINANIQTKYPPKK